MAAESFLRRAFPAFMLAAAILVGGCGWQQARYRQTATLAAPHATGSGVKVTARNGGVQVHKGQTSDGQVSIVAELRMVSPERLGQATIEANRASSGILEIAAKPPDGGWRSGEGCSFDITVPDASGLDLTTSNGPIEIAGLAGSAHLESSNGHIKVSGHDGPIDANTSNGWIEASEVAGAVSANTSNGRVSVSLAPASAGPLHIRTSNGAVAIELSEAFRGDLEVHTSNGRVSLPGEPPAGLGKFSVRTDRSRGHLTAGEGPESEARSSNGSITVTYRR